MDPNQDESAAVFGRVLRKYRSQAGLSQEKLASGSGLDRTYISLLERGLRQPTLSTMLRLVRVLDVSLVEVAAEIESLLVGDFGR